VRRGIQGTQSEFGVSVPMFYRIKGVSYPEATDSTECYARYSNALLNAAMWTRLIRWKTTACE
jgi:hypothetical protein